MRREYKGAAPKAYLTVALGGSTANVTITCTSLTNWPTGVSSRPFYVVIGRETASEEKILCISRASNVITVYDDGITNGRGADNTTITTHAIGDAIEHVFTATDADEANDHVNNPAVHWTVCTSTTRPASPVANQVILETDTKLVYAYISGSWQVVSSTSESGINPLLLIGA